ncbi:MAG: hypothetical protein M3O31_04925, partial [Acidobacteriota bacterium]|nr:hypothetical protein [Acidobacteriota bacterium]
PVSPSISRDFQPLAPQINNHATNAIKKQSENDGANVCDQGPHLIWGRTVLAGCKDEVELAKSCNRPVGPMPLVSREL